MTHLPLKAQCLRLLLFLGLLPFADPCTPGFPFRFALSFTHDLMLQNR